MIVFNMDCKVAINPCWNVFAESNGAHAPGTGLRSTNKR